MNDVVQGTPEWHALRLGKVTASRIAEVTAKGKSGAPSASRANYLAQLVVERLTGKVQDSFKSEAMERGNEVEPAARAAYAFMQDCDVVEVGFVPHLTLSNCGCSPDGLLEEDGLVQFKCPLPATHIDTLQRGVIPGNYFKQMQFEMACTGRKWCDYVSFCPDMPASMQLFVKRIERDGAIIAELEAGALDLMRELDHTVTALLAQYAEAA